MADIPHFKYPFQIDGTKVAEVEQDSMADVAGCVEVILRTPHGHRDYLPEFGTPDPTFTAPFDPERLRRAVNDWEPRAEVTVEHGRDAFDIGLERVRVIVGKESQNG